MLKKTNQKLNAFQILVIIGFSLINRMRERMRERMRIINYEILSIILILTLGSVIGMIIHRNLFIKFFLCFESFFFIISVIILI